MSEWVVRLHLVVEAGSAEEAREFVISAGEHLAEWGEGSDEGDPRLLGCCVDNESEVKSAGEEGVS